MNRIIAGLALATALCTAAPLSSEPRAVAPAAVSHRVEASVLRAASRVIYNAGSMDFNRPLAPQAIAAVTTPEPNANFLIGIGLLGVAYLLRRKTKKSEIAVNPATGKTAKAE